MLTAFFKTLYFPTKLSKNVFLLQNIKRSYRNVKLRDFDKLRYVQTLNCQKNVFLYKNTKNYLSVQVIDFF